jgi:hypothetical protein
MTRKLLDRNLGLPEIPDMYARFILCSYKYMFSLGIVINTAYMSMFN